MSRGWDSRTPPHLCDIILVTTVCPPAARPLVSVVCTEAPVDRSLFQFFLVAFVARIFLIWLAAPFVFSLIGYTSQVAAYKQSNPNLQSN